MNRRTNLIAIVVAATLLLVLLPSAGAQTPAGATPTAMPATTAAPTATWTGMPGEGKTVVVGSKNFTEEFIIAEMYARCSRTRASPWTRSSTWAARRCCRRP